MLNNLISKDRGNIGNARLMGLQSDLHITDGQFYNVLSLYCKTELENTLKITLPIANQDKMLLYGLHYTCLPYRSLL